MYASDDPLTMTYRPDQDDFVHQKPKCMPM